MLTVGRPSAAASAMNHCQPKGKPCLWMPSCRARQLVRFRGKQAAPNQRELTGASPPFRLHRKGRDVIMTHPDPIPEWLTVGAEVATLTSEWKRHGSRPTFAKVARIGKRDVVLDDEQRFNITRLERRNGGVWDGVTRLLPVDAPVVREALDSWRYRQMVNRAKVAAENWRTGRDGTSAADVVLALAPLTGRADEIAALFERPGGDA